MKTASFILVLALTPLFVFGQSKVRERDLLGEWKLVIDIDEREIKDEIDGGSEDMDRFGEIVAAAAIDFAMDMIDEIDIRFRFKSNNQVRIDVEAFGVTEVEYAEWYINRHGELVIEDEDNDAIDEVDIWLRDDELLMAFEKDNGRLSYQNVYLIRVDRN